MQLTEQVLLQKASSAYFEETQSSSAAGAASAAGQERVNGASHVSGRHVDQQHFEAGYALKWHKLVRALINQVLDSLAHLDASESGGQEARKQRECSAASRIIAMKQLPHCPSELTSLMHTGQESISRHLVRLLARILTVAAERPEMIPMQTVRHVSFSPRFAVGSMLHGLKALRQIAHLSSCH